MCLLTTKNMIFSGVALIFLINYFVYLLIINKNHFFVYNHWTNI